MRAHKMEYSACPSKACNLMMQKDTEVGKYNVDD